VRFARSFSGLLMIAVVLARGEGRRMRQPEDGAALTASQAAAAAAGRKAMMPLGGHEGGRPFLDYVLASLRAAGCDRVCLVVAPDHEDVRRRYLRDQPPRFLHVGFVNQATASGTADAVLAAEPVVGDAAFLVVNSDNLYPVDVLRDLVALEGPGLPAFTRDDLVRASNIPRSRVADFALLDVDDDGWLRRIVEKPDPETMAAFGANPLVSMNAWRFDRRIFAACRDVSVSVRGERELPAAVGLALERGMAFRAVPARGAVLDLSRRSDIVEVSRRLADIEIDM
jgi:glucose-1-phosphate thymidylyltransferase